MPKQYKAACEVHDDEVLKSFAGEDLERFRKRMAKQGHKVGKLDNAEMQLTDRGKVIWAEMQTLIEKLVKGQEELAKEMVEIKGTRPPFTKGAAAKPGPLAEVQPDIPPTTTAESAGIGEKPEPPGA